MRFASLFIVVAAIGALSLMAADPEYVGKWKFNPSKSNFSESTVTYEQNSAGEIKRTADGQSYTFKADGKDYPTATGNTVSWKAIDANSYNYSGKTNGKPTFIGVVSISADGKTLTFDGKLIKADGTSSHGSEIFQRVSGGLGLSGTWKAKNLNMSDPGVLEIALKGTDGLTFSWIDQKEVCDAKFDGKDYPDSGPQMPAGSTCAVTKGAAGSLDATWKKDGKVLGKSTFTVSSDGKTMTETGTTPGTTEKTKAAYDRQ
jgi:hypothetical protein